MDQFKGRPGNLLRGVGIVALMASATSFLVQGFHQLNSFERYLSFAGVTSLLAMLGVYVGSRLNEPKGARTLILLSAASLPVLFAQIGAMAYSQIENQNGLSQGNSWFTIVGLALATMLATYPVPFLGFKSTFRSGGQVLLQALQSGSLHLVIPGRDNLTGVLTLVSLTGILLLLFNRLFSDPVATPRPRGSWVAPAIATLPAFVVMGRSFYYSPNSFFFACSGLFLAVFFHMMGRLQQGRRGFEALNFMMGASLFLTWGALIHGICGLLPELESYEFFLSVFPTSLGLLLCHRGKSPNAQSAQWIGSFGAFFSVCSLVVDGGPVASLVLLSLGIATLGFGYSRKNHLVFLAGVWTLLAGIGDLVGPFSYYLRLWPWMSFAIFGILTIMAATWIEKSGFRFMQLKRMWTERFLSVEIGK